MIRITSPDQIGPVLADLRAMHGLTQHELAADAGVSAPRMNNWEHGTLNPTTPTLLKLLGAMGLGLAIVPVDETTAVDARWERLIETLAHHIRMTVRGETTAGPETAPESTLADEHPSAGVLGCTKAPEAISGASWVAGYDRAVAVLRGVVARGGSPAARWAADYLAADPDRWRMNEHCWHSTEGSECPGSGPNCAPDGTVQETYPGSGIWE